MEYNKRKSITLNLSTIDYLAEKEDLIEVTKWANAEGMDINIWSKNGTRSFQLTWGELDAINLIGKLLEHEQLLNDIRKE